ncbi:osmoprotectant transport system permease protein [Enterococcus sp. PF1-24]|uniref:ABC transporter permease n=1 Tax=unclassified Enterococcus TaxID=2608891 RepID=UPI00247398CC|nr:MULTISPECIES: ABC transporter permease [unclassified Enterococcus]MDH6364398.1 osmoprotectant transport system permease protein [Enterococcus sp. PFB1-1]MDH6401413.1 osmoprotectant transport system permease protein [Enterococcus sp. PF1-24]
MNLKNDLLDYLFNNHQELISLTLRHIFISLVAILCAILIAVPLGYLCTKIPALRKSTVNLFQIIRLIPSLAILILLIPIMGTGTLPAITALIILGIPPILMNTIVGFNSVPSVMIESGVAIGMNDRQVFRKVIFPLAMPLILSGIKTSLIEIIASATLASKIGGGGLGDLIFTGLGLNRLDLTLIGGVVVALLSIFANFTMNFLEKRIVRYA